MIVCRRETFNAAHRLFKAEWSDEKNLEVFGKCSNPNYHGHNYVLEVCVEGKINDETGYVIDLKELKRLIRCFITDKFDHGNLNLDCQEFANLNPTAENIALVIWNILRAQIDASYQLKVCLWETENNRVEYTGE
jgi:6-pyruvoyltetrahydropterin/6-carboxytetrahydropterin synthase